MATQSSVINNIKAWAFPAVVTVMSSMIWADVREMKSDVKHLMAESNISETKIENVEARVDKLEQVVFIDKYSKTSNNSLAYLPQVIMARLEEDDDNNK